MAKKEARHGKVQGDGERQGDGKATARFRERQGDGKAPRRLACVRGKATARPPAHTGKPAGGERAGRKREQAALRPAPCAASTHASARHSTSPSTL